MGDMNETGWSDVHTCAAMGYTKSIEKFVENDRSLLEQETADHLRQTPLLVAVSRGQKEAVSCLIHLGAKVNVTNSHNHGVIEICALKEFIFLLRYFISLDLPDLPVWRHLLQMLGSDVDKEIAAAGKCLKALTQESDELKLAWISFLNNGGVPAIIKVARNSVQDHVKIPALETLVNLIDRSEIQKALVTSGGIPAFLALLKSTNLQVVQISTQILRELSRVPDFCENLVQNQAISHFLKVLHSTRDSDILVPVIESLGNLAQSSQKLQATVGSFPGLVACLVSLFDTNGHPALILALTHAVSKIVVKDKGNQSAFVNGGVTRQIVNVVMIHLRHREIQMLENGANRLLMQMLKRSRAEFLQEKIAMALWALAGDSCETKREMANDIGVQILIEFVNSKSKELHFIGSEGLGVLAQGPLSQQEVIARANGVHPLVQLIRTSHEHIVLSVIRALRYLCLGVGYIPHEQNQQTVLQSGGVPILVALLAHSTNEVIRAEAAYTLASVSLGFKETLDEINQNLDFSYVRILKMLYSSQPLVQLTAGSALACFAYNSLHQQREIAIQGGVRLDCFLPFLKSAEEFYRCLAAYQVVILSRVISDEIQALSSATGIKLLVDLLKDSKSEEILALAADCVARLSHTRAGVPAAIVAVNAVDYLSTLLLSKSEQVRGNAAIALGYLSHDHKAERLILHRCRNDPYLMKVIKFYTKRLRLATTFTEGWQHYRKVGLPPIGAGRPSLVHSRSHRNNNQPLITNLHLEENGSIAQSDSTVNEEGDLICRSSRTDTP
ncbi:unnamed protein product [Candidula unifasciata]|uniref:Armadillo repeat-containing domain-containing protein n=1 Tax=Candidula unifasciata TaxID=100452 RepID=A0A8S3ZB33_9EUPU|nr:unnamed protein product [Candidula unifasciata]